MSSRSCFVANTLHILPWCGKEMQLTPTPLESRCGELELSASSTIVYNNLKAKLVSSDANL